MKKKYYINIAFHNFKINCAQNKTELVFQMANFNYEVQNHECIKIIYLGHYVCSGIEPFVSPLLIISQIINLSIQSGVFPCDMKKAKLLQYTRNKQKLTQATMDRYQFSTLSLK